ncbi:tyrosine-type recombinase/integrase [Cupriavidus pauculus]|uniref:tyrosine-type recombinase/integrase n=1 Tax=Cupriavidus pauculus TaxID=82633 RepID=UPI001249235C|nr:integrase family protein [Cupriavidus pauculus]KAB0595501.1 integrase family protein [Cupriavidus pauculus]MCM3608904.1 integrase family protein [Cupriavidus pauculus]UAL00370.1 integrase family protein [Cupriavidus pauculus]
MSKENFTAGRVASYQCMPGKTQTLYWDAKAPGLGLRVTTSGARAYIFESRLFSKTVRVTIGDPRSWDLGKARTEAARLKTLIDAGQDPREVKAETRAAHEARAAAAAAQTVTVSEAWGTYLDDRRPYWGERHYRDHVAKAQQGGLPAVRGTRGRGVTIAGPLHSLMSMKLCELDAPTVELWAVREGKKRPTSARLAWRLLKGFLAWCAEQPAYAGAVEGNPAKTKKSREALGTAGVKQDALQREQLAGWFSAVRKLSNPVTAAYLQTLLLTGARPGEVLEMRWEDLNERWQGLTIRDKVEGERTIPLTPYVAALLYALPRRSEWVFSSAAANPDKPPQPISKPHEQHGRACAVAGIDGLTLHGLRRSFRSLTEWLECPAGVVAQIMGHKPSATAEKHYTVRPLDLLRQHHERIEAWILDQASVEFDPAQATWGMRLISVA